MIGQEPSDQAVITSYSATSKTSRVSRFENLSISLPQSPLTPPLFSQYTYGTTSHACIRPPAAIVFQLSQLNIHLVLFCASPAEKVITATSPNRIQLSRHTQDYLRISSQQKEGPTSSHFHIPEFSSSTSRSRTPPNQHHMTGLQPRSNVLKVVRFFTGLLISWLWSIHHLLYYFLLDMMFLFSIMASIIREVKSIWVLCCDFGDDPDREDWKVEWDWQARSLANGIEVHTPLMPGRS